MSSISAQAAELLRVEHEDKDYLFEADVSEIPATVNQAQATQSERLCRIVCVLGTVRDAHEADSLSARSHLSHTTRDRSLRITKIITESITICWKSMENRDSRESSEEGSSNLIDLDSTSGLRRTSYLRIPAAKRNYVSKSFHMRKACRQWSQHVYQRPLSSSQTAPE
jgi:hypothetical protein